ncbi:F510_1955 family glycosylhydrolase [Micromonospora coxensis]|uniref:F510_1955 family glycosylhydrolase n=1 Tax=Micromonospora coxensis TaxID=356852 RepID=UPI003428B1A6
MTTRTRRRTAAPTRPTGRPTGRTRGRWTTAVAVVAAVAVLAAVVATTALLSGTESGDDRQARAGDFGHVHALAVDPGTGRVHLATHHGLYRVDGATSAVRVSAHTSDLMGFAVTGPGHFVASGHPGDGDDGPGNLGLVESTDAGGTWATTSLSGRADFHGLRAAHGALYGYNSTDGAFMVSTDRRTWEHRSLTAIGAFDVNPADPDEVLAVGRNGLQRSTDGGRSWQPLAQTPPLVVLTWPAGQDLYGADAEGVVWHSGDAGTTWQRRGHSGAPARAITGHGTSLYLATADDRVLVSDDGGGSWRTHYEPA